MKSHSLLSISSKIRKAALSSWAPQKRVGGIWLGNAGLRRPRALETLGEGWVKTTLSNPSCTHFQDLPVCFVESETGGLVFLLLFVCVISFCSIISAVLKVNSNSSCICSRANVLLRSWFRRSHFMAIPAKKN